MEKNTGYSYIRKPEGRRVVTRTGLEGQVSGRVFQRPISKFNFRAKTSLCLFPFTSFLPSFLSPPPLLVVCFFSFYYLQLPHKRSM